MALNYAQIFGDIGKLIKMVDQYRLVATGQGLDPTDATGTHTGANDASVLTDSAAAWTVDTLIGLTIKNVTDGSVGVITDNTATTITVNNGLSGGTDNDFDTGDVYTIVAPLPDIPALQTEIETQLEASGRRDVLDGMFATLESQKDSIISLASTIAAKVTTRLLNRESVINQLEGSLSLTDIDDVIEELGIQMIEDGESVKGSAITTSSVTPDATNTGTARFFTWNQLDGVTPPDPSMSAHKFYSGLDSGLSVPSELMTATVVTDRDTDGITEGHETLLWEGQPSPSNALGWRSEGSGLSMQVPSLNSYTIIQNRNFETFTANIPTSWTLESGVAGTELTVETTAADVFRGISAVGFNGTGTDVELRQSVPNGQILPDKWYCFSIEVRGDAATAGASAQLLIEFVSDSGGYASVGSERIDMDLAALQAQTGAKSTWNEVFFWHTPKFIPDDLQVSIKLSNATAGLIIVDSLAFGPFLYGNGVGLAIAAGETPLVRGDRFTFTNTNEEGIIQRFFRRYYGAQLPFVINGSETRADTLAT